MTDKKTYISDKPTLTIHSWTNDKKSWTFMDGRLTLTDADEIADFESTLEKNGARSMIRTLSVAAAEKFVQQLKQPAAHQGGQHSGIHANAMETARRLAAAGSASDLGINLVEPGQKVGPDFGAVGGPGDTDPSFERAVDAPQMPSNPVEAPASGGGSGGFTFKLGAGR